MNANMNGKWDLTRIEKDEDSFLKDLKDIEGLGDKLASLEGKLDTEEGLSSYLDSQLELEDSLDRAYHYASMASDLDKKDVKAAERLMKARLALNSVFQKSSYAEPELLELGKDRIDAFLKKHPEYSQFDFYFEKLYREKDHVLEKEREKLLSNFSPIMGEGGSLYSSLCVADLKPKEVTLKDGSKFTVTQSNWYNLIEQAKDPEDRQRIFETLYSYYDEHKTTLADIYNVVLQTQLAETKSRGYASIAESHLYGNAIPVSVLENLIEVASTENEALKRYYEIKRKYFGLEKFRSYDRFLKLTESDKKYDFHQAQETFFASIESMPEDFRNKAREANKDGYIDVYPSLGKRSGAYSTGGGKIHPYMLLNFEGTLDDVFTLAHESGHSMHTLYASETQPLMKSGYSIFVAEIASTFNEHNLLDYLLNSGTLDKKDEIYLLQKEIDEICSTFYRQALFAHFEYEAAKLAETHQPINHEVLSSIMKRLYKQYYGINIEEEKLKPLVWAYIPHLYYSPFYVYQYATSFTASLLIYRNVKNKVEGAFDRYIGMLKSGGSDFPVNQVKKAGVDLTTKDPFYAVTDRLKELVDRLEELLS